MRRGFRFSETLSGTFAEIDDPARERRFRFQIEGWADSWIDYLRNGRAEIQGTLEAEEFADGVPIEGHVLILPLTRRLIRYAFNFTGNDGNPYRYAGQKVIRFRSPLASFSRLPGGIYDASGRQVATCRARFDLRRDLLPFLASWRPA